MASSTPPAIPPRPNSMMMPTPTMPSAMASSPPRPQLPPKPSISTMPTVVASPGPFYPTFDDDGAHGVGGRLSPLQPPQRQFQQYAQQQTQAWTRTQYPQQDNYTPRSQQPGPPTAQEELWLPDILRERSKADLETILTDPTLQAALLASPGTTHPSIMQTQIQIHAQTSANLALAAHVLTTEAQLTRLRDTLAPQLQRVHHLERAFRSKQSEVDDALGPWAPKAVGQRLARGIVEQEAWCRALEESFLDDGGGGGEDGRASEREVNDWVRRYREGVKVLELRREKRARLLEGRVGGWR